MEYVIKINHDGQIEKIPLEEPVLDNLQEMVGGYIETLPLTDPLDDSLDYDIILIVNEEGKLRGLPVNNRATMLSRFCGMDIIVGDAVIARVTEEEICGFSSETADEILSIL